MDENPLERAESLPIEFPESGDEAEILAYLLRLAVLAPSSHNTQPWRFRLCGQVLELWADRSRQLAVVDPQGRELTISCGAALFYLQVAARHYGYTGEAELMPEPEQPDLLARMRLGAPRPPSEDDQRMFHSLGRRRTRRAPFEPRVPDQAMLRRWEIAAAEEGAPLYFVPQARRRAVAELVAEGDRRQGGDRRYRHELIKWIHSDSSERLDGIPLDAFGFEGLLAYLGPLLLGRVNWGGVQAKRDAQAVLDAPAVAVLATDGDEPVDWMSTGAALARVTLLASAEGVYAGYLNQPIQVPELRPRLAEALGVEYPQLLLRMGYGAEPPATPRRPVEEVLRFGAADDLIGS